MDIATKKYLGVLFLLQIVMELYLECSLWLVRFWEIDIMLERVGKIMPHDANGNLLSVGDKVFIPATIKTITQNENFCNCNLEFDIIIPVRNSKDKYNN